MRKAFLMLSGVLAFMVLSSGTGLCKTTITNIEFSPASPSAFSFSKQIDVTFDYKTDEAGGVRIFPRPMTNNSTTPSYAASGSPLYSTGSGTGSGYFTITSGETMIDHVRFQVYTGDNSSLLLEFFIPVTYQFHDNPASLTNIVFGIPSPAFFKNNQYLDISFNYSTNETGGVRIFPRPMTDNSTTPSYAASGSPLYSTGSGTGSGYFTITSGETTIDHVRFQVYNANQSALLFEFHVPVQYQFPIAFSSVPVAPNISVLVSGTKANVSWAPVSNADGYIFVYAPYGSVDYIATIDVGNKTNFAVNLFWGNVAYYTAVRAYNKNGVSPFSNVEHFIVP